MDTVAAAGGTASQVVEETLDSNHIEGASCEYVCAKLALAAEKSNLGCPMFANCHRGWDNHICDHREHRWSNSDVSSQPREEWTAQCGAGDMKCEDCLPPSFVNMIIDCQQKQGEQRTECFHALKEEAEKMGDLSNADDPRWCFRLINQGDPDDWERPKEKP